MSAEAYELRLTVEAVIHELKFGAAGEGEADQVAWCAAALQGALARLEANRPVCSYCQRRHDSAIACPEYASRERGPGSGTYEPYRLELERLGAQLVRNEQAFVATHPTRIDAHGERVAGDGRPRTTAERWHVDGEPEQDILVMDENRLVVATVMHGTDEQGEKAAQHTAALLAGAPRLADSVSTLKGMLEEYAGEFLWRQDIREAIVEADAALNEALPETW